MDARPPENGSPLRPGDILVFHGLGFVSWAIRRFDESDVDRAAIVLGPETMAEATASGLRHVSIEPAIDGNAFTYVRRLAHDADVSTVVGRALALDTTDVPMYERTVLLAQLGMLRRLPLGEPSLRRLLCTLLDRAAGIVDNLRVRGRSLLTDAEFVFRCFETAGDPRVALEVLSPASIRADLRPDAPPGVTADALLWEWAAARGEPARRASRRPREPLEPLIAAFAREDSPHDPILPRSYLPEEAAEPARPVGDDELHVAALRFRDAMLRLANHPTGTLVERESDDRWDLFRAFADVVTPGDLRYSHSLRTVTSLRPSDRSRTPGRRGRSSHDADR